ncbi:MAG: PilZ domain-containing protein [Deltaproteobacteria bacterium]|nr:PilZ domain-containing protein [Deltaproteobacteria bacterium]
MDLDLRATLHASPTLAATGEVTDIRITGAGVHFEDSSLILAVGDEVSAILESPRLDQLYELDAIVTGRVEGRGRGRRYELAFLEAHRAARVLDRVFEQIFNRRAASRVFPRDDGEVEAQIRAVGEDRWFPAKVMNVSRTGVGLSLELPVDAALAPFTAFQLYLTLPGAEQVVLLAEVRSRRMINQELIYGVAFSQGADQAPFKDQVENYVEVRRAEQLLAGRFSREP